MMKITPTLALVEGGGISEGAFSYKRLKIGDDRSISQARRNSFYFSGQGQEAF